MASSNSVAEILDKQNGPSDYFVLRSETAGSLRSGPAHVSALRVHGPGINNAPYITY